MSRFGLLYYKSMLRRWGIPAGRFLLVTIAVIGLTSWTIDATDSLQGSQTALSMLAGKWLSDECAAQTVPVLVAGTTWCVDQFPASVGDSCPQPEPRAPLQTTDNVASATCVPVSQPDARPWTHVAQHQAVQLCARAGKELLPGEVWYRAALGTPSRECQTHDSAAGSVRVSSCVSGAGAYAMVGTVWEYVAEIAEGREVAGHTLPETGYVQAVTAAGWPSASASTTSDLFSGDYVWTHASGTAALMRGGFYGSRDDAGVYTVHAAIAPTFTSGATGFRCGYRQ